MKVQKVSFEGSSKTAWLVIGDDYLPIEPIQDFLEYYRNIDRSPNTIRSYAYHLKLYWEYLEVKGLNWAAVKVPDLADFMFWLRVPMPNDVASMMSQESQRSEASINGILTAVCMFYDFHEKTGQVPHIPLYRSKVMPGKRYKGFLHHITKGKAVKTRLLKLKVPKRAPKTIEEGQIQVLIDACTRRRDKFLLCLLYETGMRIGQALGLRHEDIESMDNIVRIVPRSDNANGARAKTMETYDLHVTKELMGLYTEYVLEEVLEILGEAPSDFVFVNLWDGVKGNPMHYNNVMDLFRRLKRKTGIAIHPHMLRHTHATELIRQGMAMAYVQKRLGHQSIQTTIDTYVHVSNEDMKHEYQKYLENREDVSTTESEEESLPT